MDGMRTKTKVLSLAALLTGSVVFGMILAGTLDFTKHAPTQKRAAPSAVATAATAGFLPQSGCARTHPRRRHPQGWTVGRDHDGDHYLQRADQDSGARRCGHDGRDYPAGQGVGR